MFRPEDVRWRRSIGFAVAVVVGLYAPASAHAFERSRVDIQPERPIYWRYRTVVVHPALDSSDDVGASDVAGAFARSIATWNSAAAGCSDLLIVDGGAPMSRRTNLDGGDHDRENRIVFRETGWPDEEGIDTLALTTVVYRRSTGQILDADIDFNAHHHTFTVTDDPFSAQTDIENTLTHELGHLIGLAHVDDPDATMYGTSLPGDFEKRTLSDDELQAICHVYPEGLLSPDVPYVSSDPLRSGCGVRVGVRGCGHGWTILAVPLLLTLRRRTRASARRAERAERACETSGAAARRGRSSRARRARPR